MRRHHRLQRAMLCSLVGIAACTALPLRAETAPTPFPMNEEVRTGVRAMRGIALSPDGKTVLAGINDTTAAGGLPHLWLLAPGAKPRQISFSRDGDKGGESAGAFSPDGQWVLFLATRSGVRTLYRLPLTGGEAQPLQIGKDKAGQLSAGWGGAKQDGALAAGGFAFSPDGRHLAFWADDPEPAALKTRRERKDDGYSHGDEPHRTFLYLVDPETGTARAVKLDGRFRTMRWSYDGADMLVTTDPGSDEVGPDATIWQVKAADLAATRLDLPKTAASPAWLPGRARLVYTDQCAEDAPPRCNDLIVKDMATGTTRNLTHGLEGEIPDDYVVLPDGDLMLTIGTHMESRVARLSTRDGTVRWFATGQPVVRAIATNVRQTGWAMIGSSATEPNSLFLTNRPGGTMTRLETPVMVPPRWPKIPSKIVSWQNEGLTIEAALYLPRVAPDTKVPLIVSIHGGPAGRYVDDYSPIVQLLVAEGWAVLQPNIRGSTGYGAKFTAANKNDLGGADYRDVMAGVDAMIRDYPIDEKRMALIGYSYGGEMAGFAVGKTDRFKAIVSGAPVIDQFSEYGTEDGSHYDRWYYGRPWDNFADAWRQSPIAYARNAKTPFLLLQGADDIVDPLGQSLEMYRALKQYGAPVALIVYPREGHPETGGNFRAMPSQEPWHGIDLRRRMFGFLRAAFAGDPDPLAVARKDGTEGSAQDDRK